VGAGLDDLPRIRDYLQGPQAFEKCITICERGFGWLPTIYAVADVCRPELLVEMEGESPSPVVRPRLLPYEPRPIEAIR
jgi:hypothetical protein